MPVVGCTTRLLATAVLAVLLLPAPYFYVRDLSLGPEEKEHGAQLPDLQSLPTDPFFNFFCLQWLDSLAAHLPPVDLFFTVTLLVIGAFTYICEWIQRKLMERRIVKLNENLSGSMKKLRSWDGQQEQLSRTLLTVQSATTEYELLLYLLLRQRRWLPPPAPTPTPASARPPDAEDHCHFLRKSTVDV